ncbi:PREDICTED: trace amine-associated receptor 8a-like [Acropora digitifera]|uniref:trace amine-associated receptor 8a-like n=1 Tax=Acropora digitifera TaxID=70779 RepID=UPI00077ABB26|nr:PREDICTED: trace amine-associated receptor 8a-like [Acropora digitifera]
MEAVAMVTINALTIIVYVKERSLLKRGMYLVINQAVADMFVGVSMLIECWYWGIICDLWTTSPFSILFFVLEFLRIVFPTASIINLAAISLERTHATFRPFKHRLIKKKIFEAVVSIVWITAGLISTSFVSQLFEEHISVVLQASLFLFCLLVMVVSYSSISIKIVCGNQPHHHGGTSRERKLTKTLFIVTVVSLLLTLPSIILRTYAFYAFLTLQMISVRTYAVLDCFFLLLFYANSLVNPAFYTLRMPEFRKALFSFFNCRSQLQLSA